jgi:hypothetical protein
VRGPFDFEVESFDLDAFKADHPDLAAQYPHLVEHVEAAKAQDLIDIAAVACVRKLRTKIEAKFRAALRASRAQE